MSAAPLSGLRGRSTDAGDSTPNNQHKGSVMELLNSNSRHARLVVTGGVAILGAGFLFAGVGIAAPPIDRTSAVPTVFATGLVNPRGLKFGPDGALYLAEADTQPIP